MKFKKLSIASLLAFAVIPCFAANFAADIKATLEEYRAMDFDSGNRGEKYAARGKIFEIGSATIVSKNAKDRVDFSKALSDALKTSKDKEETIFFLFVLQFTGGEESLQTIEKFLADKDKDIADAARMALERNSSAKANEVLGRAYKNVKDPVLRSGIVNAISLRGGELNIPANEKLSLGATYIGKHSWPEIDFAKFRDEFNASPSQAGVKKAIDKGCDRAFVMVSPFVFTKAAQSEFNSFKTRFNKSEEPTKAWVLTALGGIKEAKKFIIDAGLSTDSNDIRKAAVWALSTYPDADAVKAILEIQQASNDGRVRYHGEWAIASMDPSKEVDATLLNIAKSGPQRHEAIRSIRNRGMIESIPFMLKCVKDNTDRDQAADALNQLADDKAYLEFAKIAVDTKNDDLARRLVGMSTPMAKRSKDHAKLVAELTKLEAKATDTTKRAIAKAKEVLFLEYAKMATESRQKEDLESMVKFAEAAAKHYSSSENIINDLEKFKEKTSNEGKQAIDKVSALFSK